MKGRIWARIFETRLLGKIFGRQRESKQRNTGVTRMSGFRNFCSSPGVLREMKSRRMRWVGHLARTGKTRNA